MRLAQDQHPADPLEAVSVPILETAKLPLSTKDPIIRTEEQGEEGVNIPIKPYCLQMEERTYPWIERDSVYGLQHKLQNYDICLPRPLKESAVESTVWVFFLHGGAWRDTTQDKSEIHPALSQLLQSSSSSKTLSRIAGVVSLNYGLSTYAPDDETQDPSLRLQHPKHVTDIVVALDYFAEKYNVGALDGSGHDYILVGHSAGATLAFQTWLHRCSCAKFRPAKAVVGLAGIYDLKAVVRNHETISFYRMMVESAFGKDESVWIKASPVNGYYEKQWDEGGMRVAVLAASEEDELVERQQWEEMQATLECQLWTVVDADKPDVVREGGKQKELIVLPLNGGHDEMWEKGDELRRSIEVAISRLFLGGLS